MNELRKHLYILLLLCEFGKCHRNCFRVENKISGKSVENGYQNVTEMIVFGFHISTKVQLCVP